MRTDDNYPAVRLGAVGSDSGACCAQALGPIATSMVHVARTDDGDEAVVPVINLEPENRRKRR